MNPYDGPGRREQGGGGEYSPAEVKSAVTGNGRADKAQVGWMIARLLPTAIFARWSNPG